MRLWHKDLLGVLPRQQLLSQYRECCAIAKSIKEKGTPNHILVNKVMSYPIEHFIIYTVLVQLEMSSRGYKCNVDKFDKYFDMPYGTFDKKNLYSDWHNDRYFIQNYYNLQEKYDCGGISEEEWVKIKEAYYNRFPFGYRE